MGKYVIMTDSSCDLSEEYIKEHGLDVLNLLYNMDGTIYGEDKTMDIKEFYAKMRGGSMPTTMAVNPEDVANAMRRHLEQGEDILYIAFSSGLSASCQNAVLGANDVRDEFPDRKIIVVDSLCASMGQGLFVHYALKRQAEGMSLEENVRWLEEHKLNICHQFTVDDLHHLHRGGRVSKATAILGTMINVKPVLHVDDEGKLISLYNVRGRKKSLQALVSNMEKTIGGFENENDDIFISHGDCMDDVLYLEKLIEEKFGKKNFYVNYVGAVIGAHSGPGTMALFYLGNKR
ncbi:MULTISPECIES: DegV family protein [unclassified Candidatus Paralachnospira]|uniref:DegV family protein n=1 Tax=unclassified Candidatus Paralachnospira TaxID=3099471 RepID=UPI003F927325